MDPDPETPNRKPEAWDLTPQTSNLKLSFSKNQRPSRPCCHHSEPAHLFEAQTARNARNARNAQNRSLSTEERDAALLVGNRQSCAAVAELSDDAASIADIVDGTAAEYAERDIACRRCGRNDAE